MFHKLVTCMKKEEKTVHEFPQWLRCVETIRSFTTAYVVGAGAAAESPPRLKTGNINPLLIWSAALN